MLPAAEFHPSRNPGPGFRTLLHSVVAAIAACSLFSPGVQAADYRDDTGYPSLATELGSATPQGTGVAVSQIEGAVLVGSYQTWMVDLTNSEFTGKSLVDESGGVPGVYSGHATSVGKIFYGNQTSVATGVASISVYNADTWLTGDFLKTPATGNGVQPLVSGSRVENHSWVGHTGNASADAAILRRLDWVIGRDEMVSVIAVQNGGANDILLVSTFNSIAVGRSDGNNATGTAAVDSLYTAGRARPDLVAPFYVTSYAAPVVAAAAAVLVEAGHANAALSTDPVTQSTTNRALGVVRNAERSEVIKAALMAGALRSTSNVSTSDITDYRVAAGNQTSNGLDRRFGAGQVNILNSYHVVAAGEKNSLQDFGAGGGQAGAEGFDYDPRFGGANATNDVGTYNLPIQAGDAELRFALAWNVSVNGGTKNNFNGTAQLFNLDAFLYDVTNVVSPILVASSESANDNTENLYVTLTAGRAYAVEVKRSATQAVFDWDYGAAWQIAALPPPDADNDGIADSADNCPLTANPGQADADGDGIGDACDNCTLVANADQFDGDNDGYGNYCDGDLNNNGVTNAQDTVIFRSSLGSSDPVADLNHNGIVNAQDNVIFRGLLGLPPGPSGLLP